MGLPVCYRGAWRAVTRLIPIADFRRVGSVLRLPFGLWSSWRQSCRCQHQINQLHSELRSQGTAATNYSSSTLLNFDPRHGHAVLWKRECLTKRCCQSRSPHRSLSRLRTCCSDLAGLEKAASLAPPLAPRHFVATQHFSCFWRGRALSQIYECLA